MKRTFWTLTSRTLISIVALAAAWSLVACSDNDSDSPEPVNDPTLIVAGDNDPLGEPIGLIYYDFLTEEDVTHNADTTELRISKALADKKGITNFVNRPMGVWDKKEHISYLRRATEQRLDGDHYVLKVVPSSIAEVTNGQEITFNTGIYYDPSAPLSRKTRAAAFGDLEASKYVDDNNVIHPVAITLTPKADNGGNDAEVEIDLDENESGTFTIEELYTMRKNGANSIWDDIGNFFKKAAQKVEQAVDYIVQKTSYDINADKSLTLLDINTKLTAKKKLPCGEDSKDTIGVTLALPIDFKLDYYIKVKATGSIKTAEVPIPSYLETYIDGTLDVNPKLLIGFSKELSIPKDKQRIPIYSFSGISFTFTIGPVPVNISVDPSVYIKFTASVAGDAYLGMDYHIATNFKAGFKYDGGFSGITGGGVDKNEFDFIYPTAQIELKGGVGLYFGADVIIEQVAGPSFCVGPQINADAKLSYTVGDDHLNLSAEAKAGIGGEVGGKVKIFGFDLAEWKTSFDIGPQWTIFKYPDDGSTDENNPNYKDYSSYNYIPTDGTGGTGDEGYDKLFDGNRDTKWCTSETKDGKWFVEFKSREPITMGTGDGYCLVTANDAESYPGRNPVNWVLYGKLYPSDQWEELDRREEDSDALAVQNKCECWMWSAGGTYKYFRLEISKVMSGGMMQISEFMFADK